MPLLSTIVYANPPAIAQTTGQVCIPLQVVSGNGTQVRKRVSLPGTLTSRSNWNTDFVVPGNEAFRRYVAAIEPLNRGKYHIQMFLKYSNSTADKVYDQAVTLPHKQEFVVSGAPRIDTSPYQVNLSIGGVSALGNTYRATVSGCY